MEVVAHFEHHLLVNMVSTMASLRTTLKRFVLALLSLNMADMAADKVSLADKELLAADNIVVVERHSSCYMIKRRLGPLHFDIAHSRY